MFGHLINDTYLFYKSLSLMMTTCMSLLYLCLLGPIYYLFLLFIYAPILFEQQTTTVQGLVIPWLSMGVIDVFVGVKISFSVY